MTFVFYAVLGLLLWQVIGLGVLAWIDKDEQLIGWVKRGPWFAWPIVVTFWPVVAWKYRQQP